MVLEYLKFSIFHIKCIFSVLHPKISLNLLILSKAEMDTDYPTAVLSKCGIQFNLLEANRI